MSKARQSRMVQNFIMLAGMLCKVYELFISAIFQGIFTPQLIAGN
jgi:hypothetical protein